MWSVHVSADAYRIMNRADSYLVYSNNIRGELVQARSIPCQSNAKHRHFGHALPFILFFTMMKLHRAYFIPKSIMIISVFKK